MKRERDVEAFLKLEVERRGGRAVKLKFIGWSGAPDRLVLLPGRRRIGFLELKHPDGTGKVSRQQQFWIDLLLGYGIPAAVAETPGQVLDFLLELEAL